MDEVERGNTLTYEKSSKLEYLVFGRFMRRDDDVMGVYGAWWVRYTKLLDTFDEDSVDELLETFETEQSDMRQAARGQWESDGD